MPERWVRTLIGKGICLASPLSRIAVGNISGNTSLGLVSAAHFERKGDVQKPGVRQQKRGDREVHDAQTFLVLERIFTAVTDFAIETLDLVENHAIVFRSASKPDRIDYLITVQKLAAAKLNRPLRTQFTRLMRGEEVGAGSRRMCVAKLANDFIKSELFPRARWFAPSGWVEVQRKKQQTLSLLMTPAKVKKVADAYFISPNNNRYFDEVGAPPITAEPGWTFLSPPGIESATSVT
jgi:hypothetical protein